MKPKVILDTNVFVATGFNPASTSARIIDLIRQGELELVWDERTKAESEKIVRKIPLLKWEQFEPLFDAVSAHATGVNSSEFDRAISDPDDRKFAALATSSQAVIISNDSDLLDTQQQSGVKVLTPKDFMAQYRED